MGNTIQNYPYNHAYSYGKSIRFNMDASELGIRQPEDKKNLSAAVAQNDAATVEISALARSMYHASADDALAAAGKAYTEAFASAAEGFADFSMKIEYGSYASDVSVKDLDFDAVDRMEDIYQSYKKQIQSGYEGDERDAYLNKLDEAYNAVFKEKIIKPVKGAYDEKLYAFKPDDIETVKSIRGTSANRETMGAWISGYVANQAIRKKEHDKLSDGTRSFYDMAGDKSLWHDTDAVKGILTDSMKVYSSVRPANINSSDYLSAKSAADAIAKKISDQYAETLAYKAGRSGQNGDGEDADAKQSSAFHDAVSASSGLVTIDFSKIPDLKTLWDSIVS